MQMRMSLNCTLKNGSNNKLQVCTFYHKEKVIPSFDTDTQGVEWTNSQSAYIFAS